MKLEKIQENLLSNSNIEQLKYIYYIFIFNFVIYNLVSDYKK